MNIACPFLIELLCCFLQECLSLGSLIGSSDFSVSLISTIIIFPLELGKSPYIYSKLFLALPTVPNKLWNIFSASKEEYILSSFIGIALQVLVSNVVCFSVQSFKKILYFFKMIYNFLQTDPTDFLLKLFYVLLLLL